MSTTIKLSDGAYWDYLKDQNTISIEAIAHALACLPRYTGHAKLINGNIYSVAEHCVKVSSIVPTLQALMHDASEAIVNDLSRPLKVAMRIESEAMRSGYDKVEDRVHRQIFRQYGIKWPMDKSVKHADNLMLVIESRVLMDSNPESWNASFLPLVAEADAIIDKNPGILPAGWGPGLAKELFIARFRTLSR